MQNMQMYRPNAAHWHIPVETAEIHSVKQILTMVFVYKTLITGPLDALSCSELKPYIMAVTLQCF